MEMHEKILDIEILDTRLYILYLKRQLLLFLRRTFLSNNQLAIINLHLAKEG